MPTPVSFPNLTGLFPRLTANNYEDTSVKDTRYNCAAFAAGEQHRWWQHFNPLGGKTYWPAGVPREPTIFAYSLAYQSIGYQKTETGAAFVVGKEKIALFEKNGAWSHAARQLDGIFWSSKLGNGIDIKHHLTALEGGLYGNVAVYLERDKP